MIFNSVPAKSKIKCAAGTLRAYLQRRTDDVYIVRIQPQLSVRGSWGTAPSVFWFLLYEQKERLGGEPYRPSPSGDSATPIGDYKLSHPPGMRAPRALHKATPAARRSPAWPKNLLPAFLHRRVTPRQVGVLPKPCTRPRRQAPTNPPLIRTTNPSFCFPIKPTIYTILAQYLPKM